MSIIQIQHTLFDKIAAQSVHVALWSSIMSVAGGVDEIFINHSARMNIAGEHAVAQLLESHERAKYLGNLTLIIGGVSGLLAYRHTKDNFWLFGSGLVLAAVPYCYLIEYPIADQLKSLTFDVNSLKATKLLEKWRCAELGKLSLIFGGATIFYWFARH